MVDDRATRQRTLAAEATDRAVDKLGIERPQSGVAEPEPRRNARPEALDDDVAAGRDRQCRLARRRLLEVERQAALAGVDRKRGR